MKPRTRGRPGSTWTATDTDFDRAFGEFWHGVETIPGIEAQIPLEWLLKQVELNLSEDEKKQIQALGGWDKLMETLKQRLEEQKGRHQGGSKMIGTAGTSPFGAPSLRAASSAATASRFRVGSTPG